MTNYCYLTVDLEDYKYATMDEMGVPPIANSDQTQRGLERLLSALAKVKGKQEITLFTTGQVARSLPRLVQSLSKDKHEIACHSNEHGNVFDLGPEGFRSDLRRAIKSLEDCTGQKVEGFRAPNFSIREDMPWADEILAQEGILYDSSKVQSKARNDQEPYGRKIYGEKILYEFPIYHIKFPFTPGIRVIGGTYFRLLPLGMIVRYMKQAQEKGYIPMIYMHPADLDDRFEPVLFHEMAGLGKAARLKWAVHQNQWSTGTKGAAKKLEALLTQFPPQGTLAEFFKNKTSLIPQNTLTR